MEGKDLVIISVNPEKAWEVGLRFCKTNGYVLTNNVVTVNMFDSIVISNYDSDSKRWRHRYHYLASFASKKIIGYRGNMPASANNVVEVLAKYRNDEIVKLATQFNAADERMKNMMRRKAQKMTLMKQEIEPGSETTYMRCPCCLHATPKGMALCMFCNAEYTIYEDEVKHYAEQGAMPPDSSNRAWS